MPHIGAHVSVAGGLFNSVKNAEAIGANAFALFTRNPRSWHTNPLSADDIALFKEALANSAIEPQYVVPHDSYLINMSSPKEDIQKQSLVAFLDEARRVEQLGLKLLNFHPGSPSKTDPKAAMQRLAEFLKTTLQETNDVILVLEATAGQGNHLGVSFEELATIIELAGDENRLGVCIDTCHIFAAGYDIRTEEAYLATMQQFDAIIGRKFLKAMHLNDSMKDFKSRVDRHAPLGEGFIGLEAFKAIMHDPYMQTIPLILETPNSSLWPAEIELLRKFAR